MLNVSLCGMILLGLVGRFGQEVLAATSAVLSYAGLSSMPVVGMSIALSAAVGKSIGEGRKDLAGRQTNLCVQIGLIYMGLVGLCFFLLRNKLVAFWSSDARVIEAGVNMLICAAVYQVFDAARIVYGGSLRGAGDTLWPAVVSAVGAVLILGLGGWCVTKLFPATAYMGPWVMSAVSIAGIGVANCWRFKSNRWMSINLFERRATPLPTEIG
jgi:Na+-driven multidrug efflux pump